MKTNVFAIIRKWGLLAWTAIMMTALMGITSVFAVYPSELSSMKRVVLSTAEERGLLFSSNLLAESGMNSYTPQYKMEPNSQTNKYEVDVYLWNHSVKDFYTIYGDDIAYTLAFRFTNKKGEALNAAAVGNRSVIITDDQGNSFTLNSTQLAYDVADETLSAEVIANLKKTLQTSEEQDSLKMEFDGEWNLDMNDNICVQVTATLDRSNHPYSDLQNLGAVIGLKRISGSGSSGWNAYLNEHRGITDQRQVNIFDGFNIVAEGSGEETITIEVDTTKYVINKYFYGTVTVTDTIVNEGVTTTTPRTVHMEEVSYTPPGEGETIGTLVINANSNSASTSYRNRYTIQLYKAGGADYTEPTDWSFFAVKKNNEEPANWSTADVKITIAQPQSI